MKRLGQLLGGATVVLLLGGTIWGAANYQYIRDWWVLKNYAPTQRISSIAANTSMTETGRKLFYLHDPQIETAEVFNVKCTLPEKTQVLGCFDGTEIVIYDVQDERLAGIHEVTAAHEMLHAAYRRLSPTEKERVDQMTLRQYQKITDDRLIQTIQAYRERDESVVPNELHSILGTEVRQLDPELEEYYGRYFERRLAVVELSENYEQVFKDNAAQRDRLQTNISLNTARIENFEQQITSQLASLKSHKATMDQLVAAQKIQEYNSMVDEYNADVVVYRQLLADYNTLVQETNSIITQYNQLVTAQNDLIRSLDSRNAEL